MVLSLMHKVTNLPRNLFSACAVIVIENFSNSMAKLAGTLEKMEIVGRHAGDLVSVVSYASDFDPS